MFDHSHDHSHDDHDHDHADDNAPIRDPAQKSLADALRVSFRVLSIVMIFVVIAYLLTGVQTVKPQEIGILKRFGRQVGLAQEGDRVALNSLLGRYMTRILRVVKLKRGPFLGQSLGDSDLVQEVMIRVWRSLEQYDPSQTASFLLWVTRIADNALRDLARR